MKRSRYILLSMISVISSFTFSVGAQSLPSLPKASEVSTGTLPNGISFYIVTNREAKGSADFALVQKRAVSEDVAKSALSELPHFQGGRPYQYLAKLGVGYKNYGYFRSAGGSVTYHFENVPVNRQEIRDTTLLLLFDISETCPYEQAVIISGDIDQKVIQERMNVFSMMVTPREKVPDTPQAEWKPSEILQISFAQSSSEDEGVLTVSFSAPRAPREAMGTVQTLVSDLFAGELGIILSDRVRQMFMNQGIPVAGTEWRYRSSADSPYQEQYRLSVTVPAGKLPEATNVLGSVLSSLDSAGVSSPEFRDAKGKVLADMGREPMSNADWVDKCSSAFLYGSDLASLPSKKEYLLSRGIDPARELALFNDFVSALIDDRRAVSIRYEAPWDNISRDEAAAAFAEGWKSAGDRIFVANPSDTLGLSSPKKVKAKLKRAVPEPVSGGELWTFSNGMKVIFKNSSSRKGSFSYGFMLNGGYTSVPGLTMGEGGFVGDMLGLCNVAGLSAGGFSDMLAANDISLHTSVGLTDLRITGSAPSSKLPLLLRSLISLANERTPDRQSYEYYRDSELLRLSVDRRRQSGIDVVIDSLMCPDYIYTGSKKISGLSDDLPDRAAEYFSKQFSKCDDGVIVLIGDLDPYVLKKVLPKYLGSFQTGGIPSTRPQIQYTLRSGWTTYTVEAEESSVGDGDPCVNVSESVMIPFTLERYMASKVASKELEKMLAAALSETGTYAEVSSDFELFPAEKLSVHITCRPADERGLPEDVFAEDPLKVLGAVRSALADVSSVQDVSSSKAALLAEYESQLAAPSSLVDIVMMRYSVGKDMVSGYKDKINSVSPESVRELLTALEGGGKVEFVIY